MRYKDSAGGQKSQYGFTGRLLYKNQKPRDAEEVPDITLESVSGMADAILKKW